MSFYDFAFGGLSGVIATTLVLPLDTVKVRIQLLSERAETAAQRSFAAVVKGIWTREGPLAFYKGLDAAIFRQATYSTARMGIYRTLFRRIQERQHRVTFLQKVQISLTAGVLGAILSCPSELALVRFQSDGLRPPADRRNYRNVVDAFRRIVREEGAGTLWRGSKPTIARAAAMNVGMLTTYDEIKERLNGARKSKDSFSTQLAASFCAGFVCSFMAMPFDNAKIKLQSMKRDSRNELPYKGLTDCMVKTVRNEGIRGLWAGYPTFATRVGKHSMLILIIQDLLHAQFNRQKRRQTA